MRKVSNIGNNGAANMLKKASEQASSGSVVPKKIINLGERLSNINNNGGSSGD